MSTLKVGTITDTSGNNGSTPAAIANGIAKAWVNFNGTGTVPIRASYNVSSITDNGTGDYTVNFTTALADTNASVQVTTHRGDGVAGNPGYSNVYPTAGNAYTSITASSVRTLTANSATSPQDMPYVGVTVFR